MVRPVQAHPIRITLSLSGPPGWETGSSWMVGESRGPAMAEILREIPCLAREAVPRLAAGWAHTDAAIADHAVRVHITIEGPSKHAESIELFGVGTATGVSKREIEEVVRRATRFIVEEVARMELAWADTIRYWRWMREQEEARARQASPRPAKTRATRSASPSSRQRRRRRTASRTSRSP